MIKDFNKKVTCPSCYKGTLVEKGTDYDEKDYFCTTTTCNKCNSSVDVVWHRRTGEIKEILEY